MQKHAFLRSSLAALFATTLFSITLFAVWACSGNSGKARQNPSGTPPTTKRLGNNPMHLSIAIASQKNSKKKKTRTITFRTPQPNGATPKPNCGNQDIATVTLTGGDENAPPGQDNHSGTVKNVYVEICPTPAP
ncbi:MAG TPA: hypothetical protein VGZ02_01290 [Candidatus Baltobacteraceae bacterium]|jgi:hypothetical protein|nr:hypothetical protein [Candidatus Baltobacteraceae bacterium]